MKAARTRADPIDPSRHLDRARAALREAAEHLADVAAAEGPQSRRAACALAHVDAARKAIGPFGLDARQGDGEQDAA